MGNPRVKIKSCPRIEFHHSWSRIRWCVMALAMTLTIQPLFAQATDELIPRLAPDPPFQRPLAPTDNPTQIILKFREGSSVRMREGRFVGADDAQSVRDGLSEIQAVLSAHGITFDAIKPLHTRPETDLEADRKLGQQRSGRQLADLNLYYVVTLPVGQDIVSICDQLNELPIVEQAIPGSLPPPPPIDLSPPYPRLF